MTTKYECDRCRRQFMDERAVATVNVTQHVNGVKMEHEYHFCEFCRLIVFNALSMAMNGKYGGSLRDTDMIGYFPDKENDPLFMEAKE